MFQSLHTWSHYHAAARAISGGPIYITDSPNQHDTELIRKLVAQRTNGEWCILRSTRSALPTEDSLFSNPNGSENAPLKVFNIHRTSDGTTWGVVGAWSGQRECGDSIIAHFSLADIGTLSPSEEGYAVYLMTSRHVLRLRPHAEFFVDIHPTACEIATFAPLSSIRIQGSLDTATVGCFGLVDKFNASQPIITASCLEGYEDTYCVRLAARSNMCGFFLQTELASINYEIFITIDNWLLPAERVRYYPERNLVTADLTVSSEPDRVNVKRVENDIDCFVVTLKLYMCGF
jgi:hypothetical protein